MLMLKIFAPSMQPNKAKGVAAAAMKAKPNTGKKVPDKIRRAVNDVKEISRIKDFALKIMLTLESTRALSQPPDIK